MLLYNLQYFAKDGPGGEKTEEPTSKKLEDARKEGQVAKSKEIASSLILFGLFLMLKLYKSIYLASTQSFHKCNNHNLHLSKDKV